VFRKPVLYQGTTSVVPKKAAEVGALAPEGLDQTADEPFMKHALEESEANG
jgi:hypothetical protein